jgi:glycosyltransferase involved in cell wall biosynthesis
LDKLSQITVILCTYNRAHSLGETIESIVTQTLPQSLEWELLVVDNNSTDETPQVVEGCRRRYPGRIRYLFEPKQGVSHARNTGVRSARGEIIAFIDDDETADLEWLQKLTVNLFSGEWLGAGGRVVPKWNGHPPRWVSSNNSFICGPLAMFDPDAELVQLTEPPFGANMAFRKEAFDKYGGFRTDLGRIGKGMLSGEDTEFGRRLMAAGALLRYEPLAVTHHPVEKIRVKKRYFLVWWFNKGRSDVRELGVASYRKTFFGIPVRLLRDAAVEAVRWIGSLEPSRKFICTLKICNYAGQAFECYHQALEMKRKRLGRDVDLSAS